MVRAHEPEVSGRQLAGLSEQTRPRLLKDIALKARGRVLRRSRLNSSAECGRPGAAYSGRPSFRSAGDPAAMEWPLGSIRGQDVRIASSTDEVEHLSRNSANTVETPTCFLASGRKLGKRDSRVCPPNRSQAHVSDWKARSWQGLSATARVRDRAKITAWPGRDRFIRNPFILLILSRV